MNRIPKYALALLLIVTVAAPAQAQKNNMFGDVGISMSPAFPGASFTYNRKLIKWLGIGAGVQGYWFDRYNEVWPLQKILQFTPAIFGDIRFYIPGRRHEWFILLDVGEDFYRNARMSSDELVHSNGVYSGLGVGYAKKLPKLRIMPYLSLKIVSDAYTAQEVVNYRGATRPSSMVDATLAPSVGVRF